MSEYLSFTIIIIFFTKSLLTVINIIVWQQNRSSIIVAVLNLIWQWAREFSVYNPLILDMPSFPHNQQMAAFSVEKEIDRLKFGDDVAINMWLINGISALLHTTSRLSSNLILKNKTSYWLVHLNDFSRIIC